MSASPVVGRVLSKLERVKRNGAGWTAKCPAHDDRNPSLSIAIGEEGRVLLKCHAGCELDAILAMLGLEPRDLFDTNGERAGDRKRILTEHPYVDERGELLFEVVRFTPKSFAQRIPDGKGGWRWGLGDTRRVVYRYPRVRDAIRDGLDVLVVEGEKDVEAIERTDPEVVATTNPQGAGKWRAEYAQMLRGARRVIVVADRDEPGRQHAAAVASSLEGLVDEVVIAEPAEGKDVAEHLAAGRTLDELVRTSPAPDPSGSTLEVVDLGAIVRGERPPIEPQWLARSDGTALLYPGHIHDVHGEPSVGKTWLAAFAAVGVLAAGENVLILDYEDTPRTWVDRLLGLGATPDVIADSGRLVYVNPGGRIGRDEWGQLEGILDVLTPALVIIDAAASSLARNGLDENSNADVSRWSDELLRPIARHGAAVLFLDHVTKDPAGRRRGGRGAGAKLSVIDAASYEATMVQAFSRERAGRIRLKIDKDRPGRVGAVGEVAAVVDLEPGESGCLTITVEPPEGPAEPGEWQPTGYMERLSRALEIRAEPLSREDTLDLIPGRADTKRRALAELIRHGYVQAERRGRSKLHRSIRPYREHTTDHGPTTVPDGPGTLVADDGPPVPTTRPGTVDWGQTPESTDDDGPET